MFSHNGKISTRQVILLLILQMFSTSMLILPRIAAYVAAQDGYILPIIGFLFGSIYIITITALTNRFRGDTIVEFAPKIITKPLGTILCILFLVKIIINTALELRMFGEMISQVLLPKTPLPVIILAMLFAVSYLIKSGIEASGRMGEIVIYFVGLPLLIILLIIVGTGDYKQLMPFFQASAKQLVGGGYYVSLIFSPIELMLLLAAFMKRPEKARKSCFIAAITIAVLEIIIIVTTFAGIGVGESKRHIWPVLTLMQSIQFPGSFIENQEILMMTCWIMSIYMYVSGGLYFAMLISSRLLKFKRENITILPLIPIVYFIAMLPNGLINVYKGFIGFQSQFGIWFLFPVPLILLIIAKLRKVGSNNED